LYTKSAINQATERGKPEGEIAMDVSGRIILKRILQK
jgi:hypothetical protein